MCNKNRIFATPAADPCLKGEFTFFQMVPGVIIDDARHPPKNATVKNFTSTDFLGPIKFDSPNGGTSNSRIKKNVNSPQSANNFFVQRADEISKIKAPIVNYLKCKHLVMSNILSLPNYSFQG